MAAKFGVRSHKIILKNGKKHPVEGTRVTSSSNLEVVQDQKLIKDYEPPRALRSANTGLLDTPSLKTAGQKSTRPRKFALLAPKLWNDLPVALRTAESLPSFCRGLKTHLFRLHHSP